MTTLDAYAVTQWIRSIRAHARQLPIAVDVKPPPPSIRTATPPPASRPPIDLELVALLDARERWTWDQGPRGAQDSDRMGALPNVVTWAAVVEADLLDANLGGTYPPLRDDLDLLGACRWLLLPELLADAETVMEEWPQFADDMHRLHVRISSAVQHLLDRDASSTGIPCTSCRAGVLVLVDPHRPTWGCTNPECGRLLTTRAVTIAEAAAILGASRRTLHQWAAEGRFTRILGDDLRSRYDLGQISAEYAASKLRQALKTTPTTGPEA